MIIPSHSQTGIQDHNLAAYSPVIIKLNRICDNVFQTSINLPWLWISIAALIIRIPLLFLPNPGRDEAAYFYWSRHFEPAYSFLMQFIIRLFDLLPIPDLLAMRLPSLLLGILVIFLLDKLLELRGVSYPFRWIALLVFAFSPWQSNFGVLLNPDNFLVAVMLLFLLAVIREQFFLAAVLSGIAVLAKPTGVLLIPAGWYVIHSVNNLTTRKKFLYGLIPVVFMLPVVLTIREEMIFAMLEFGKMNPSLPMWEILALQLILMAVGGGPLLAYFSGAGLKQRLAIRNMPVRPDLERRAALFIGLSSFIIFGGAIVLNSQVKYNWILPALVILLPTHPVRIKKYVLVTAIVLSVGLGIFQNVLKLNPPWIAQIENSIPGLKSTFVLRGGVREAHVSTSRSWTEHALEFQNIESFVKQVEEIWEQQSGSGFPIQWIVSDDYGLAAQLIFALENEDVRMVLPKDGIFTRTIPDDGTSLSEGILILAVQGEIGDVWIPMDRIASIHQIRHPVTGQMLSVGIPARGLSSD